MATSLESQLIRGAGQAASKDPYGMVMQAQERAGQKLIKGVEGLTKKIGDIKAAELAEEEKLQAEQDDLVKSYDTGWEANMKQYVDDKGLPVEAWRQATGLAEEIKVKHDACSIGKEGNTCRKEASIELRDMAGKWTGANETMSNITETYEKYQGENPTLTQSNYDKNSPDGIERKAILNGLNKNNITNRMKNDDKIAELREDLKSASPDNQMGIEQEIEALEKSNERVVGWDIPEVGFVNADDDRLSNLFKPRADEISTGILDRKKNQIENNWDPYKDGTGGEPFDMQNSIRANKGMLNKGNLASAYHDDVLGTEGTLKENLLEKPIGVDKDGKLIMLKNASYKDLGITPIGNGDDIIDEDELQEVINALSDPKHPNFNEKTSIEIAAEYMAMNEKQEYQKHMYGHDFLTLTPAEKMERIKERTDPTLYDDKRAAMDAGLVFGAQVGKGEEWSEKAGTYVKKAPYSGSAADIVAGILGE